MTEPTSNPWRRRISGPARLGSIQGKLLVMLLLTSILSTAIVGYFGYRSGTKALRESTYSRVQEIADERLSALQALFVSRRAAALLDSQGVGVEASRDFNAAFDDLATASTTPAQRAALTDFYRETFLPRLQENTEGELDYEAFVPRTAARKYLQAHYTVKSGDFDASIAVDDAGDGSAWTAANRRYNPYFRSVVQSLDFDDALLLNSEGTVVYSAYKGAELGSNIHASEYAGGNLEKVFDEALRSNSRDFVAVADFEFYQPAYGEPVMFVASPVGTSTNLTGVLVYEISVDSLNAALSGSADPKEFRGLGATGMTYLVGSDGLMRSDGRLVKTNPKLFGQKALAVGIDKDTVDRMVRTESSVLLQPDHTRQRTLAERGRSGVMESPGALGDSMLVAYQPAKIDGLDWSLITQIHTEEALAPIGDFTRNLLLATAALVLLVSALSVLAARAFTRPVGQLLAGVRDVATGKLGTRVNVTTHDEFADLADGFNDMSASLLARQQVIDDQQERNLQLLRSLMPDEVAESVARGESSVSRRTENGSVVYVNVDGVDAAAIGRTSEESLQLISSVTQALELTAKDAGVDRVRMVGSDFLGSCGLVTERADHMRRVIDFALGAGRAIQRISSTTGAALAVRIGIDSGEVSAGVAASGDQGYKLWGEAVSLAFRLPAIGGDPGIYVTDAVREQMEGAYTFEPAGTIDTSDGVRDVWKVEASS